MMFVRTVNGYMYYPPGTGLTPPNSGASGLSASSAITSPTGATAIQAIPNVSSTTMTPSPMNGAHTPASLGNRFAGYTPAAAPSAGGLNGLTGGVNTINGALTGYTHAPSVGSLTGINGIGTGINTGMNGLATAGLSGGLAAMSTTTAFMGTMGAKWMLPGWNPFGLRFSLVRHCLLVCEIHS